MSIMLRDHPTVEDLAGFLRSGSEPGTATRNAQVLRHLLADCSACRLQLRDMGWGDLRLERLFRFPVDREGQCGAETAAPYDYSRAFAAAEEKINATFAQELPAEISPKQLLAELALLPQDEQARQVTTRPVRSQADLCSASRV